jgi:hypothetical protein
MRRITRDRLLSRASHEHFDEPFESCRAVVGN